MSQVKQIQLQNKQVTKITRQSDGVILWQVSGGTWEDEYTVLRNMYVTGRIGTIISTNFTANQDFIWHGNVTYDMDAGTIYSILYSPDISGDGLYVQLRSNKGVFGRWTLASADGTISKGEPIYPDSDSLTVRWNNGVITVKIASGEYQPLGTFNSALLYDTNISLGASGGIMFRSGECDGWKIVPAKHKTLNNNVVLIYNIADPSQYRTITTKGWSYSST